MIILNVGCGDDFRGDVRVDIHKTEAANIVADTQYLPLRSKIFDFVFCLSVLEHVPSWSKALKEIMRVSKNKVLLEVPVNSDLRKTDVFRLLIPTPHNIKLFFSLPKRARETFWQMNPKIMGKFMVKHGFDCAYKKIFQFYAGMPSRCWRLIAQRRIQDAKYIC